MAEVVVVAGLMPDEEDEEASAEVAEVAEVRLLIIFCLKTMLTGLDRCCDAPRSSTLRHQQASKGFFHGQIQVDPSTLFEGFYDHVNHCEARFRDHVHSVRS